MWISIITSLLLITLIVFIIESRKAFKLEENKRWQLADSSIVEEWPRRPPTAPKNKNDEGIYIDRLPIIADTHVMEYSDNNGNRIIKPVRIAGEDTNSFPLYTTLHNDEEQFLTTVYISFHTRNEEIYMDLFSADPDFKLNWDNHFFLCFTDGEEWVLEFTPTSQKVESRYANSIQLTEKQLHTLATKRIDKWCLLRVSDVYYTVGSLSFDIRKYIYKPELQASIRQMAKEIYTVYQREKQSLYMPV